MSSIAFGKFSVHEVLPLDGIAVGTHSLQTTRPTMRFKPLTVLRSTNSPSSPEDSLSLFSSIVIDVFKMQCSPVGKATLHASDLTVSVMRQCFKPKSKSPSSRSEMKFGRVSFLPFSCAFSIALLTNTHSLLAEAHKPVALFQFNSAVHTKLGHTVFTGSFDYIRIIGDR
jgi:hypothetical protein